MRHADAGGRPIDDAEFCNAQGSVGIQRGAARVDSGFTTIEKDKLQAPEPKGRSGAGARPNNGVTLRAEHRPKLAHSRYGVKPADDSRPAPVNANPCCSNYFAQKISRAIRFQGRGEGLCWQSLLNRGNPAL